MKKNRTLGWSISMVLAVGAMAGIAATGNGQVSHKQNNG